MRVALALAALLAAFASMAGLKYATSSPAPPPVPLRPAACDDPEGLGVERAGSIAAIFVTSTVISVNGKRSPECSYDLVTDEVRQGKSRSEWKTANPIGPFLVDYRESVDSGLVSDVVVDYRRAGVKCKVGDYEAPPQGCRPVAVQAELYVAGARDRVLESAEFLIRLVLTPKGWRVDYWGPLVKAGGVGPPRMSE
jgi:hypothetical protein